MRKTTILLSLLLLSCNGNSKRVAAPIYPVPPPLEDTIEVTALCHYLEDKKPDSSYRGNAYLIMDTVPLADRILQEYICYTQYGLILRKALPMSTDSACIRPFFDSLILYRFHKNRNEIMDAVDAACKAVTKRIDKYQVSKGLYFQTGSLPVYPGGMGQLRFSVLTMQQNHSKAAVNNQRTMFYFTIDTLGKVANVTIYEHAGKTYDSLTLYIMSHLPQRWQPATLNGLKVNYWMQYAINW